MLYNIEPLTANDAFAKVAGIQQKLVEALCAPYIVAEDVTPDWVAQRLTDVDDEWVSKFCALKDSIGGMGLTLLEHMRFIAGLPNDTKRRLSLAFGGMQRFDRAYAPQDADASVLVDKTTFKDLDGRIWMEIRGLFESFYNPGFYASGGGGYRLRAIKDQGFDVFDKTEFLRLFIKANPNLGVCPMCDGSLGDAEVDHFLPKSKYPFLSMHPLNLVPICQTCNNFRRKGDKVPLDPGDTDPTAGWFHPYLRPAAGQFCVRFLRTDDGLVVDICGVDQITQRRVDNLDALIGLRERWSVELQSRVKATVLHIGKHLRRSQRTQLSEEELCTKLAEWADSAEPGLLAFSLLGKAYLAAAATKHADLFDELLICAGGRDPLTGKVCEMSANTRQS